MSREWKEAFCVLCGRTMGYRNISPAGKPYVKVDQENLWDKTRQFTGDKPFGVVKSSDGRGTMKLERYYDIDEDTDGFFPAMRDRLLAVLREWKAKGWISNEEVLEAIR